MKQQRQFKKVIISWAFSLISLFWVTSSVAGGFGSTSQLHQAADGSFQVAMKKSGIIPLSQAAQQVSVGDPDTADILIFESRQLYVVGKQPGTTNVVVWNKRNKVFDTFNIEVTHDLAALKYKLHELLPGESIKVSSAQQKLVLSGQVSNLVKMDAALRLAAGFVPNCQIAEEDSAPCPNGIINLMQIGGAQQVMLEIKVAEIARTVLKTLGGKTDILQFGSDAQIGAVSGGGSIRQNGFDPLVGNDGLFGPEASQYSPGSRSISGTGLMLSYLTGDVLFQSVLEASRENGLAKILAEPTVTTLTGQEAEFLSGGEFPIPVAQDLGSITIEFKEFGVGVKFLPVVLDSGRINLKLNIEVSELSNDAPLLLGVGNNITTRLAIPSLSKRSTRSTVELANGQTMGIAGLISDNLRESVDKFPGLGDVPMLGALFRSQEFRTGQTELVIFVTPHLAKPISADRVRLPTDAFVPPDDSDFYLEGRMEAPTKRVEEAKPYKAPGSAFGHGL